MHLYLIGKLQFLFCVTKIILVQMQCYKVKMFQVNEAAISLIGLVEVNVELSMRQ